LADLEARVADIETVLAELFALPRADERRDVDACIDAIMRRAAATEAGRDPSTEEKER